MVDQPGHDPEHYPGIEDRIHAQGKIFGVLCFGDGKRMRDKPRDGTDPGAISCLAIQSMKAPSCSVAFRKAVGTTPGPFTM